MLAPQSDIDVRPVVEELRLLDRRLDVQWNPHAKLINRPTIDVRGGITPAEYDGRWEVVIWHTGSGLHKERDYSVVYQVRGEHDEYKPIGPWLVEFMRKWDAQQSHYRAQMDALWAAHEKADEARGIDEDGIEEHVDRVHFQANYAGGVGNWQGKGADFAAMLKAASTALAPPNGQAPLINN